MCSLAFLGDILGAVTADCVGEGNFERMTGVSGGARLAEEAMQQAEDAKFDDPYELCGAAGE